MPEAHPPQCCGEVTLVTGADLYPYRPDLADLPFWKCHACGGYVGCHKGTNKPLGSPATEYLRRCRSDAHRAFDPLWQSGQLKRKQAYRMLAAFMEIEPWTCHIGWFDADQCLKVMGFVHAFQNKRLPDSCTRLGSGSNARLPAG